MSKRRRSGISLASAVGFSAVLLATIGAISCGKILGVDDYRIAPTPATDAGVPATKAFSFIDPGCGSCVKANCAAPLAACEKDALCAPWQACTAKCKTGDTGCQSKCFTSAGSTNPPIADMATCYGQYCLDGCKVPAAAAAYSATCADASLGQCDTQLRNCDADPACRGFYNCLVANNCALSSPPRASGTVTPNPDCTSRCMDSTGFYAPATVDGGTGANPTVLFTLCTYAAAYQGCGYADLSCIGHYDWATASTKTNQTISVSFYASTASFAETPGTPVDGVAIRACAANFLDCVPPNTAPGPVHTAPNGYAPALELPTDILGDYWYFEVVPPWPNGPTKLLFESGRRLPENTLIPLAMDPADLSEVKVPGHLLHNTLWRRDKAVLALFSRSCEGGLAAGLEIRVEGSDGGSSGAVLYGDSSGFYYSAPCGDGSSSSCSATYTAMITGIEPGFVKVSAWKDGTTKVAEETVVTEADSVTILDWMYPLRAGSND